MSWLWFIAFALTFGYFSMKVSSKEKKINELNDSLKNANESLSSQLKEFASKLNECATKNKAQLDELAAEKQKYNDLANKYMPVINAEIEAARLKKEAEDFLLDAKTRSNNLLDTTRAETKEAIANARAKAEAIVTDAQKSVSGAHDQAQSIIAKAKADAERVAGDAYTAMQKATELESTIQAMEGTIKGYGDTYIVPTYSLLDDLADEFSHTDAGNSLRRAREHTRNMVIKNQAATCDYVEAERREAAIRFVIDAFNGKVDSILSRVKGDNVGKLDAEIRGAYSLVNHGGAPFRKARLHEAYLDARIDELKWAATTKALQDRDREEQRKLREQIREEERARKEFERAIKDAEKEEAAIHKAMEKVQAQVAKANEEQKAAFEAQLKELEEKLREAEERGKRAMSMAQQTRMGHVYVISNIGSFGENVYKIGMTRRLDPLDRVAELGDASVPFEFDVHAMIYSEDAPALEKSLHKHFLRAQVNKVNPRKEFFRLGVNDIMAHVEAKGIEAHWTLTAKAASYRETLRIEEALLTQGDAATSWEKSQTESINAEDELANDLAE